MVTRYKKNGEERKYYFQKGYVKPHNAGRQRGTQNKITTELKRAVLEATAMVGRDGRGKDGLHGYLMRLAIKFPKVYCRLLEKILPMQIKINDNSETNEKYETVEELRAALAERGLPPPSKIIDITPVVVEPDKEPIDSDKVQ